MPHSTRKTSGRSQLSSSERADLWEHACLLYHSYEWQSAANVFSDLEHYTSDSGEKFMFTSNKGLIEARLGDLELALESFTKALTFEEDNPTGHFLLGLVHAEIGNYDKGQMHFETCLDNLDVRTQDYRTRGSLFDLNRLTVEHNISRLRSLVAAKPATAAEDYRVRPVKVCLHAISAEVLFEAPSRSGNTSQTNEQSSTESTSDSETLMNFDEFLRDPIVRATQPTELAGLDVNSLHLAEDADMNLAVTSASKEAGDRRKDKRPMPRDAQVRDESTGELAQFLRHAGPGGSANVTVDRNYMQRLLTSTVSSATQLPDLHIHQGGDFDSLLALYTDAPSERGSIPLTLNSSKSEATVTRQTASPEQTTIDRDDVPREGRDQPPKARRPTLETTQRWFRKEVRPPWLHKLAAASEQRSATRPARDRSQGTLSNDEGDARSLPSVASSTEMFTFGRRG